MLTNMSWPVPSFITVSGNLLGTDRRGRRTRIALAPFGFVGPCGPRRSGGSGCSVGLGEGFGQPVEEQVEASVEFGGAVVGGEGGCEGA
jgi:hypothetical protein